MSIILPRVVINGVSLLGVLSLSHFSGWSIEIDLVSTTVVVVFIFANIVGG